MFDDARGMFEAGDEAFGLEHLRPGTGLTPEDDRLLALGYPHMFVPVDGAIPWSRMSTMRDVWKKYANPVEIPREWLPWRVATWRRFAVAHRHGDTPPQPDEDASLDLAAVTEGIGSTGNVHRLLWALEAVHGSEAVARRVVERIESWTDFGHKPDQVIVVRELHFVLLRVRSEARRELVGRLEALFDRVKNEWAYDSGAFKQTVKALDLVLHGRAGVERSGYRPNRVDLGTFDLMFAWDDPAFVRDVAIREITTLKPADHGLMNARVAFLGGDDVVQAICDNLGNFHSKGRKRMVAELGRFAHPAVPGAMKALAGMSGSKSQAKAWLKAHT